MPVFAREAFGSAADLGVMYGVFGGATLVGALAYSAVGHRFPRRLTFVSCFSVVPVLYLVMFGAFKAGAWASIPLGVLLGGVVVEAIGVAATFFDIGLCYLAVTAYGFINPAFRGMDRRQPLAREHAGKHTGLGEHSGG